MPLVTQAPAAAPESASTSEDGGNHEQQMAPKCSITPTLRQSSEASATPRSAYSLVSSAVRHRTRHHNLQCYM
eukprot:2160227-Pleurochrysis_carterae.AAC.1